MLRGLPNKSEGKAREATSNSKSSVSLAYYQNNAAMRKRKLKLPEELASQISKGQHKREQSIEEAKQEYGRDEKSGGRGSGGNSRRPDIPKTKDIAELVRKSKEYTQALI